MCLIKTKDKSKHLPKRYSKCRKLGKLSFVGLMMRFSYFLNQLINTNVNVNIKEEIGRAFALSMKEYKKSLFSHNQQPLSM